MSSKLRGLKEAIAGIPDGALLALGGNTLNRAPMAAVYELARQGKRGLRLVKTAGGMDVDLLCLAGCVKSVDAGFVSLESFFGLCPNYRRQVEQGQVQANEHACYTVISALRAAASGLPFMPVRGLQESDLTRAGERFAKVRDPFNGGELWAVRAISPDVALLHVHLADHQGNGWIQGPCYDDLLMMKAAKRVILTAEKVIDPALSHPDSKAQIPHFLVDAVVEAPHGASPSSCQDVHPVDEEEIASYLRLTDQAALMAWLDDRRRRAP
ncbi:MAG: CoA transferase subunit A [Christensenellales bacterium]